VGGKESGFFQVMFGVENGMSSVHCPIGQGTMYFPCKLFLGVLHKFTKFHRFVQKSHEFYVMVNMNDIHTYSIS
jgi:hypothetical protein